MSLTIILVFLAVAALGLPMAFGLGLAALVGIAGSGFPLNVLPSRMMNAVNAFPLMSIPFFVLAGEVMLKAGIMEQLIGLANAFVGRLRGGLAHVTMGAGLGLSTVSGAAVADASALASILFKPLSAIYGPAFSAAVISAAANLGPLIPPSGAMIVYAFMAGPSVSVGGLFMSGVVPGLILVVLMMGMCSFIAHRQQLPLTGEAFSWRRAGIEIRRSVILLLMPVIVIGGIVSGAFTATEGSAIAVIYALIVGFFVTRKLRLADLPEALVNTAITSAVVGAMIAFASIVTYILTIEQLPQQISLLLRSMTSDPIMFILLVTVMLVIVGCVLESTAAYIMLVPLLHPVALQYGIDPLHFGFLFVFNLVIGMLTPPVGVVLFVVSGITRTPIGQMSWAILPFVVVMYLLLVVCIFVPQLVLWLPHRLGY